MSQQRKEQNSFQQIVMRTEAFKFRGINRNRVNINYSLINCIASGVYIVSNFPVVTISAKRYRGFVNFAKIRVIKLRE